MRVTFTVTYDMTIDEADQFPQRGLEVVLLSKLERAASDAFVQAMLEIVPEYRERLTKWSSDVRSTGQ